MIPLPPARQGTCMIFVTVCNVIVIDFVPPALQGKCTTLVRVSLTPLLPYKTVVRLWQKASKFPLGLQKCLQNICPTLVIVFDFSLCPTRYLHDSGKTFLNFSPPALQNNCPTLAIVTFLPCPARDKHVLNAYTKQLSLNIVLPLPD